ncbi:MAG: hypothetical protein V3R25_09260 [Nitrosomonadaceae bacterium]
MYKDYIAKYKWGNPITGKDIGFASKKRLIREDKLVVLAGHLVIIVAVKKDV